MTLGFKQEIGGKPTYFAENIIAGLPLPDYKIMTLMDLMGDVVEYTSAEFYAGSCNPLFNHVPKLHTIREDKNNLWAAGKLIHPVINNRTANRFQFAPVMKCVSVQEIRIKWHDPTHTAPERWCNVLISTDWGAFDLLSFEDINKLAINDGFDNEKAFFAYFNKDFTGKIIHWTDLKY